MCISLVDTTRWCLLPPHLPNGLWGARRGCHRACNAEVRPCHFIQVLFIPALVRSPVQALPKASTAGVIAGGALGATTVALASGDFVPAQSLPWSHKGFMEAFDKARYAPCLASSWRALHVYRLLLHSLPHPAGLSCSPLCFPRYSDPPRSRPTRFLLFPAFAAASRCTARCAAPATACATFTSAT